MTPEQRARAHVLAVMILMVMGGVATVALAVPADGRIMGTMKDQSGGVMAVGGSKRSRFFRGRRR